MKRFGIGLVWALLLGAAGIPVWSVRAQEAAVTLPFSEGFEGAAGKLPPGWSDATTGEVAASVGIDNKQGKEGTACLRLEVDAWYAGAARVRRSGIALKAGTKYSVEVWLRGVGVTAPAEIALEKPGAAGLPGTRYLARQCAVGLKWRRFVLQGEAPADVSASLTLSLPGTGTLYADGIRVSEGEAPAPEQEAMPAIPPTPARGNRIYNSGFELGLEGWTIPEEVSVIAKSAADSDRYARLVTGRLPLEARPIQVRPGVPYTISAYLRSDRPGALAEVALVEVGNAARVAKTFDLTSEWTRFSFTATLPCEASTRYFLSIGPSGEPHGLDVDAVQVEEGDLTTYAPEAALEVGTGLARAAMFPEPDTIMTVPVPLYSRDPTPAEVVVRYRIEGFYGEGLTFGYSPVKAGLTHGVVPVRVPISNRGTQRLVVEAVVGRDVVSQAECVLTCLPAADPKPNPNSFFGAHGSMGTVGEWHAPTVAARAGVRWWRLHGLSAFTEWAVAEPERGKFTWFDRELTALRSRGLSVLGVFARTPRWAGEDPSGQPSDPFSWPPARMADFTNYVRQVTAHYKGQIPAYEIWSEPWSRSAWMGTPEKYAELAKAAVPAAKAGDPAAKLIGGSFWVPRPEFTDRVLAKGLLPAVDGISHHQYTEGETVSFDHGKRDQVSTWYEALHGKLTLAGGKFEPIWNTEGGTSSPSYYSWLGADEQSRAAARTVAKTLILNKAAGVSHYFYYHLWQEGGAARLFDGAMTDNLALLDYDGSGKPGLGAYAACAQSLEGAAPAGRVETEKLKAYVFHRGDDSIVAVWSPAALTNTLELGLKLDARALRALDLMGNPRGVKSLPDGTSVTLRNEPVYLHLRGIDAEATLDALRAATVEPTTTKLRKPKNMGDKPAPPVEGAAEPKK